MVTYAGRPAFGQFIYMDANGDGLCTTADVLIAPVTSVDIYLNTNHNGGGFPVLCNDGTNPLDISSYDLLLHVAGPGSVAYGTWTNAMAGYKEQNEATPLGSDFGVGYADSSASFLPPGLYKLGSLSLTVAGNPTLYFLTTQPPGITAPVTGFGSHCSGSDYPNTITLGMDFFDSCIPWVTYDSVEATTWGKIKQIYR